MRYIELQITSNFSFLRGASHPHELVDQAAAFGYKEIAFTDRNTFAGLVRAHVAAKAKGIRLISGCRLDLQDGPPLLAYPTCREAYGRLSALLSTGNLRAEKGECLLYKEDVYRHAAESLFIAVPPAGLTETFNFDPAFGKHLQEYREAFGSNLYLAGLRSYRGNDHKMLYRLSQLSVQLDAPMVATGDVHYHEPHRRQLQDILTCIREKCTIHTAGFRLHENAEKHLKTAAEMQRLFRQYPDAIIRTQEIAEACSFSLDSLSYEYPEEITPEGRPAQEELNFLTWKGANERFGEQIPEKVAKTLQHELNFIEEKKYAAYFLTVYDIVRFARRQGILCQGRGSAANSAVCYCLGITAVDPNKFDLLFERFISSARNEPPDIDVDFEHERREEVIQYIYDKYGRDRAAIVATVTQLHQKGAVRDVGKAMGLSVDTIGRLSDAMRELHGERPEPGENEETGNLNGKELKLHENVDEPDTKARKAELERLRERRLLEQGLNPHDPHLRQVITLTRQLMGFPRQLGQHTGGFVITRGKLSDLCPIMNARMDGRTTIEWNKDDIDALGFLKIDVLALGMLTCIRKAFDLINNHYGSEFTLATIPQDDKGVYEMISHADTIGVFQIESRAQQSMLPRLRPEKFYDLVIEVAIVRPGPIQGDMVHPYLRRRNKEEEVTYPSEELKAILYRTLGVPLFQEQAMKIAMVAAGFTPAEADELRRSMATFKLPGTVARFKKKLIEGMASKGYTREFASRVFKQLEGFGSYGFPESHAASFALLVYISSWIKYYYPEVFAAALLNSQPMGFYQPAQIVIDAREHGVEVLPVDVNHSEWDHTLEAAGVFQDARPAANSLKDTGKNTGRRGLRLGFRQVRGLREEDMETLIAARGTGYTCIPALRDASVPQAALEKLADADAFRSLGLDRRRALWEVSALDSRPVALFAGQPVESRTEAQITLPLMTAAEHVVQDYASTSLSLKAHPVSFLREKLRLLHVSPAKEIGTAPDGKLVKVAGLVLVRQRPGTASGICFITIEDETGTINLVVFRHLFETYHKEILGARLLMAEGQLQREGEVIHVILRRCFNLSKLLPEQVPDGSMHRAETNPSAAGRTSIFPKARDFK